MSTTSNTPPAIITESATFIAAMNAGNSEESLPVARSGAVYSATASAGVTDGPAWAKVSITASRSGVGLNQGEVSTYREGWQYLPPKVETLDYDDDGNLLQTARWQCAWDAENRLVSVEERHHASRPAQAPPRARLEFAYDQQGRRVRKVVRSWDSGTGQFVIVCDTRFVYDGWNMIAELDATPGLAGESCPRLVASHAWGLDLSGTETGAGGVGGLVLTKLHATTVNNSQPPPTSALAPAYDGNGNVLAYLDCATGKAVARYEYDAYGNVIEKEEAPAVAGRLHHQFSTKFTDDETGWSYYGFRYYSPELGRWPSRDPIEEEGGINLLGMVGNDLINDCDYLGLIEYSPVDGPEWRAADAAGRAAIDQEHSAKLKAIREGRSHEIVEWGGRICCCGDGKGKSCNTTAKRGSVGIVVSESAPECPNGFKHVGWWHSHPGELKPFPDKNDPFPFRKGSELSGTKGPFRHFRVMRSEQKCVKEG